MGGLTASGALAGAGAAVVVGTVVHGWTRRALRVRRRRPVGADRPIARAVVVAVVGLVALALWPPVAPALAGWWWLRRRSRRVRARRVAHRVLVTALPEAVELAAVAARAGLTVPLVVAELADRAPPPLGPAFASARQAAAGGRRLADALAELPAALGEPVRSFVVALVAADRDGAALLPALAAAAADARRVRSQAADLAARRLSVRLLFPLVVCILPAFVVLGLVPLLVASFQGVRLR